MVKYWNISWNKLARRTSISVILVVVVIAIVGFDFFLEKKETSQIVNDAIKPKAETYISLLPTSTTGEVVHHTYYSLSYNEKHEQAEWVAYPLKKEHLSKLEIKRPYFEIDRAIKTGAASWKNYKNSGYDRGHLCPAGDRRFSVEAFNETFLTSNITPQNHEFNSGIWNKLEQKTRYWAAKMDGVYVITGGILMDGLPSIGNENVSVPRHFYKVLTNFDSGSPKMIAFLMPHKDSDQPLQNYVVSVDSIESLTGIDFFPSMEDNLENRLEQMDSYRFWVSN